MVDDIRNIRSSLLKLLINASNEENNDEDDFEESRPLIDSRAAKALLTAVFSKAGKGKDEIVQIIAREIGVAVAAMLKEPLSRLAESHKLQFSIELTPKNHIKHSHRPSQKASSHGKRGKKKIRSHKK